jgi:hypothetical protein
MLYYWCWNEKLHALNSSPNVIRLRWEEYVSDMGIKAKCIQSFDAEA